MGARRDRTQDPCSTPTVPEPRTEIDRRRLLKGAALLAVAPAVLRPGAAHAAPAPGPAASVPSVASTSGWKHAMGQARGMDVAAVLRRELMSARRAVGAALRSADPEAERAARDRVQRAKTALGERGTPWWEQDAEQRRQRWEAGLPGPQQPPAADPPTA